MNDETRRAAAPPVGLYSPEATEPHPFRQGDPPHREGECWCWRDERNPVHRVSPDPVAGLRAAAETVVAVWNSTKDEPPSGREWAIEGPIDRLGAALLAEPVPLDVERLTDILESHWLVVENGVASCTCGEWKVSASDLTPEQMRPTFRPFSAHVAARLTDPRGAE